MVGSMTRWTASQTASSSDGMVEMRNQEVVGVQQESQAIPLVPKLALVALGPVLVDAVVHRDGDDCRDLSHERGERRR